MRKSGNSRRWPLRGMPQQEGRRRPARRDRAVAPAWRLKNIRFNLLCPLPPPAPHFTPPERVIPMSETQKCRCKSHLCQHPIKECPKPAIFADGLCDECHDKPITASKQRSDPPRGERYFQSFFCPPTHGAAWRNRPVCGFV